MRRIFKCHGRQSLTTGKGFQPYTDEPGGYRILRSLSVGNAAWEEIDIRSASMSAAADGTAQSDDADTDDSILRCISIVNTDSTADIQVAIHMSGDNPSPADAYVTAYSKGPGVELRFPAFHRTTSVFVKANAVSAALMAEIWYDIPPTSY